MRQSFPSAALRSPPPPPPPSCRNDPEISRSARILLPREYHARVCLVRVGKKEKRRRRRRQAASGSGWKEGGGRGRGIGTRAFISNCNARSRNARDPRRCLDTTVPVRVFLVTRFPDQPRGARMVSRGEEGSPLQTRARLHRIPFLGEILS